ncbi:helix-turn-helix transcriptional regulator, partial [Polymorphobacter multimanifer]|uniref:helix-turn-helix transcriptional regulator n=1 Tax=Polymorphobacter multimanifer TaxID=1070431 RepID=UPI001A9C56A5
MLLCMSIQLSDLVRSWRKRLSLKQEDAAARLGITQSSLSRIETGQQFPDRETARLFVEAGALTAEQLGQAMVA